MSFNIDKTKEILANRLVLDNEDGIYYATLGDVLDIDIDQQGEEIELRISLHGTPDYVLYTNSTDKNSALTIDLINKIITQYDKKNLYIVTTKKYGIKKVIPAYRGDDHMLDLENNTPLPLSYNELPIFR